MLRVSSQPPTAKRHAWMFFPAARRRESVHSDARLTSDLVLVPENQSSVFSGDVSLRRLTIKDEDKQRRRRTSCSNELSSRSVLRRRKNITCLLQKKTSINTKEKPDLYLHVPDKTSAGTRQQHFFRTLKTLKTLRTETLKTETLISAVSLNFAIHFFVVN